MSINLSKGSKINLSKDGGTTPLKRVRLGLGWSPQTKPGEGDFDLDSNIFALDANGKLPADEFFVFYNNKVSPDAAIIHMGDNRTGADAGTDAERIKLDLTSVDPKVKKLSLVITIDEAKARHQNFGRVKDSYVSLTDEETGKEFARYILEDEAPDAISVHFGELERHDDGGWSFTAVGQGYDKDLADYVRLYGGDLS
ncbi:MAG TPA: TerD family protein [Dongiaceae bacterium]|nr:TerD family protein [Dongiaceae bacterium]